MTWPAAVLALSATPAAAQVPPSASEIARYEGVHRAAHEGDADAMARILEGAK